MYAENNVTKLASRGAWGNRGALGWINPAGFIVCGGRFLRRGTSRIYPSTPLVGALA